MSSWPSAFHGFLFGPTDQLHTGAVMIERAAIECLNTCQTALIDFYDHIPVAVFLVISAAAMVARGSADNDRGGATRGKRSHVSRRSAYSAAGGSAGDAGDAARCGGPSDPCFSPVDRNTAGQWHIHPKTSRYYAKAQYDMPNTEFYFHYLLPSTTSLPNSSTFAVSSFCAPSGTLNSN